MSRFFFDTHLDETIAIDEEGTTLPDAAAAEREGREAASDIAQELFRNGRTQSVTVSVRDEAGARIAACRVSVHVDQLAA